MPCTSSRIPERRLPQFARHSRALVSRSPHRVSVSWTRTDEASTALSLLGELAQKLEDELGALLEKQSRAEAELEGLRKQIERPSTEVEWEALRKIIRLLEEIEDNYRMSELVGATEEQLAAPSPETGFEGEGPGASTQVRGSARVQSIADVLPDMEIVSCGHRIRQRIPSSGLAPPRPSSHSLSP
jgi:hypothetical protein